MIDINESLVIRVLVLFGYGMNTADIAKILNEREADVERALHIGNERSRQRKNSLTICSNGDSPERFR